MPRWIRTYPLTFTALGAVALSLGFMGLGVAGVLPRNNFWLALVIPASIPIALSAALATSLSISSKPLLWLISMGILLLPFSTLDWVRARRPAPDAELPNGQL